MYNKRFCVCLNEKVIKFVKKKKKEKKNTKV